MDLEETGIVADSLADAVLKTMLDGAIVINERGVVQFVNPAFTTLLGYEAEEVVGRNVSMIMPTEFAAEHDEYLRRYQRTGNAKIIGIGRDVVGLHKEGHHILLHLSISELETEGRRLYAGIVRDLGDRELARRAERDRVAAELRSQVLGDTERFLRRVLDAIPLAVVLVDGEGRIAQVNHVWRDFCVANGGNVDTFFVGQPYVPSTSLAGCEDARQVAERLRRVLDSSEVGPIDDAFEYECHSPEALRWFRMRMAAIEEGGERFVIISHDDITDLRRAELSLKETSQSWRTLVETAPAVIRIIDSDGRVIFSNKALTEAEGGGDDGTENIFEARGESYRATVTRAMKEAESSATLQTYEVYLEDAGEGGRWYSTQLKHLGAFGAASTYLTYSTDVTERVRASQALSSALEDWKTLVSTVPDAIVRFGPSGEVIFSNATFQLADMASQRSFAFEVGSNVFASITSDGHKEAFSLAMSGAKSTGEAQRFEAQLACAGEREVWISARIVALKGLGQEEEFLMVATDITEQKAALEEIELGRRQLLQAQKMEAIGLLAGGIAHDFNNLLTVIMSFATTLRSAYGLDDRRRSEIDEILGAADVASALTSQLLAFSRQEPVEDKVIDVAEHLHSLRPLLERSTRENIVLSIQTTEQRNVASIAPNLWDQVILNLVVNARDAMPHGGKIDIRCEVTELTAEDPARGLRPGDYVCVTVRDTGDGMDEETLERIFDPFFTTKRQEQGSGLGLSTCHGIIGSAGGKVLVESEPGVGTTFTIYLPRCDAAVTKSSDEIEVTVALEGNESVLLVEDNRQIRSALRRALERAGYDVEVCRNGREAIDLLESHDCEPDILLSDILMPGASGYEVAEVAAREYPSMPVLLTTGYRGDAAELQESLGRDYPVLRKPFSPPTLLRELRKILDSASKRDAAPVAAAESSSSPTPADSRARVLVVDDNPSILRALTRTVSKRFEVGQASSLESAIDAVREQQFDAIVCDYNLQDGTGMDLLAWLEAEGSNLAGKLLFLTGGGIDESERDFLSKNRGRVMHKPPNYGELLDRLQTLAELSE